LNTAWSQHDHFYKNIYNDDAMWWGTAALYAYRAYGDATFLTYASGNWDAVTPFQITAAQASSGTTPKKNFAFKGTCDSTTMAGGVFWTTDPAGTDINAITTGLYMTLSAYLASATGNSKYTTASEAAAKFIFNHVYDQTRMIALDTVEANDCSKKAYVFTYNSGKFIEGLSVLAQVTGNTQYSTWMQQTIAASVRISNWQGTSDGIITEGQQEPQANNDDGRGFKAIFIRGLTEARIRNPSNASLKALVRAYVNVQYNALLDLSRSGSSYGVVWHGPYQGPYAHGQLAALDVINAGISVNNT